MKVLISVSSAKEYLYGMRIRPFSIGTQPKGHTRFIDNESVPANILKSFSEPDYRFGIIVYPHPLSERDIDHYSLTDLNVTDDDRFNAFREFAKRMRDYDIPFSEFNEDYIHPRGELRSENPLHAMPINDLFSLMQRKGYPGRIDGVEKFYNSL